MRGGVGGFFQKGLPHKNTINSMNSRGCCKRNSPFAVHRRSMILSVILTQVILFLLSPGGAYAARRMGFWKISVGDQSVKVMA